MCFVLKRDPVWFEPASVNRICGSDSISLLSEDGHQISVPTVLLLAASPLVRIMVSDLHPAVHGPLSLSVAVTGDVLSAVGEICITGVANIRDISLKLEVQLALKMIGLEPILKCCKIGKLIWETVYDQEEVEDKSGIDVGDREVKIEILVKLDDVNVNKQR